jgi:hypothetical protein
MEVLEIRDFTVESLIAQNRPVVITYLRAACCGKGLICSQPECRQPLAGAISVSGEAGWLKNRWQNAQPPPLGGVPFYVTS